MQVVVFGIKYQEKNQPHVQELFDALQEVGATTYVYRPYLHLIEGQIRLPAAYGIFEGHLDFRVHRIDVVIVLGGDGTMLDAVTHVRDSGVPMLGINLGRLGFLANIEKHNIRTAIQKLAQGRYTLVERTMLYLESAPPLFGDLPFALNDCTILKSETSSMVTIHTYLNGDYLNTYWADGIVIATPTGSTAYSLSCGGPIVMPDSGNIVLTPVAPHNLNMRPLVLSDRSVISFEIEGRIDKFVCTLDSRHTIINAKQQLAVRRNDFGVRLVQLEGTSFAQTLREKLTWGADMRN
ncbi:MAG: NAD kinase [Saprospiraceae bacterium]|nr:NAD kinase [Saprospiraceae bacterium]MDW8229702.1 NAD kinase [Saprospiraceae bacterium]